MLDAVGALTPLGAVWFFLAHRVGDWLLQNDWMASEKTRRPSAAVVHGVLYAVPFIPLCGSVWGWLFIAGTHVLIDRYRLARHVTWASNQFAPRHYRYPYRLRHAHEGSNPVLPDWLATHIRMETDSTMHHLCNLAAVVWL